MINVFAAAATKHSKIGTAEPKLQLAHPGDRVYMLCYSTIEPEWIKNDISLGRRTQIVVDNVNEEDSGKYFCKGSDLQMKPFLAVAVLIVAGM